MKETTLEQFRALAATGEVVPVCREIPGDMDTPVSVLERFVQDDNIALLESVEGGESLGRHSRPQYLTHSVFPASLWALTITDQRGTS